LSIDFAVTVPSKTAPQRTCASAAEFISLPRHYPDMLQFPSGHESAPGIFLSFRPSPEPVPAQGRGFGSLDGINSTGIRNNNSNPFHPLFS